VTNLNKIRASNNKDSNNTNNSPNNNLPNKDSLNQASMLPSPLTNNLKTFMKNPTLTFITPFTRLSAIPFTLINLLELANALSPRLIPTSWLCKLMVTWFSTTVTISFHPMPFGQVAPTEKDTVLTI
jgi:hypothetical protein